MTVLRATEPATPYLSLFARIDSFIRADLEDALFESKSLVKQLAMRRTLFVFPRDLLAAALSSPSARVAQQEAGRLVKDLERSRVTDDGASWLATAREAAVRRLAGGAELSARGLRQGLVELAGEVALSEHKPCAAVVHMASRVADLPVTERDLVWWFGATKGTMREALSDLNAVQVRLERAQTGWVLPDDVDPEPPVESWAALLPALDPTSMGWRDRDFYVDPDFAPAAFAWAGNVGTTAWWDGQIVGAYQQDDAGQIELIVPRDQGLPGGVRFTRRPRGWVTGSTGSGCRRCTSPRWSPGTADRANQDAIPTRLSGAWCER
jgi:Winged helix DNA-binding domain